MLGANINSGAPATGELLVTRGGIATFTNYSGTAAGNDVAITTGAGRLNTILIHTLIASGQSVFFYDSAVATSGGPFAASGHKIVGIIPTSWSGAFNVMSDWARPFVVDMPFTSGLVAATRSGTPGFSISYTPETSGLPGPA